LSTLPHSPVPGLPAEARDDLRAPTLWRRLAAFVYEGVLLFGVLMIAGLIYSSLTQMRHALVGTLGLQIVVLLVLALYFAWFWTHGGQTVAMKAWHLRLVDDAGRPVGVRRALARFALAWLWFLPALALAHLSGLRGAGPVFGSIVLGVIAYALLSQLHPQRQFWHDALCGTRLINWRPVAPGRAPD
jgi:uncharacterized RDD family membrane protein YckC